MVQCSGGREMKGGGSQERIGERIIYVYSDDDISTILRPTCKCIFIFAKFCAIA